ncbi:MAG: formyltetrahydrofolate deformylase [Arcobacter sp.]|nr:MAG: formyltetrahydrofolate deformylase [Arcobacter sp.]
MNQYRILIDCADKKGLVFKISKLLFELELNILSNHEFVDSENQKFFMRSVVEGNIEEVSLREKLLEVLDDKVNLHLVSPIKKNIVLMVTKESHCLGDILIRYEAGELDANIVGVVSNYDILGPLVQKFNIPFFCVSHLELSRDEHEAKVLECLAQFKDIDYIVLAKYMRILTPTFVEAYKTKIVNIHHSFLPSFIGANPYKQAHERGVKIIGATAHFVTNDLDEGPIISQDVINVKHDHSWKDMQRSGRDVEKITLSRALKLVLEDRIFVHKNKTVIF